MEDFKNLIIQVGLTWLIGLFGSIALGEVFVGIALAWKFIEEFLKLR